MKPFDIELAKAGHPVCTRDGKPARIICFDRRSVNGCSIVALIDEGVYENFLSYNLQGRFFEGARKDENDLFMDSKKKEGWVNVFINSCSGLKNTDRIYSTKAEALKFIDTKSPHYIDTVKIEWEE